MLNRTKDMRQVQQAGIGGRLGMDPSIKIAEDMRLEMRNVSIVAEGRKAAFGDVKCLPPRVLRRIVKCSLGLKVWGMALVSLFSTVADAKVYRDENGLTWYYQELNDDSAVIANVGDNDMFSSAVDPGKVGGVVSIPAKIYDLNVVEIGENALSDCTGIISIIVPEGVKTISDGAFYGCRNLTGVSIPHGVTSIGARAFTGCVNLRSVDLPDTLETIGESAFSYRKIGVVDRSTFAHLDEIRFPASIKSIGASAFCGCTSLTNVAFEVGDPKRSSGLTIGDSAFAGCQKITSVVLPDSISSLGKDSFSGCTGVTNLTFIAYGHANMMMVGENAFYGCTSLTDVILSSNVVSIGKAAFNRCTNLRNLKLVKGLQSIAENAFYGCAYLSGPLTFPSTVQSIGRAAFYDCSRITDLTFEEQSSYGAESVLAIGKSAFFGCSSVTNLYLPRHTGSIDEAAFQTLSALVKLSIPTSLTEIADSLFTDCRSIKKVVLPETLHKIGSQSFYYNTSLVEFTIPSAVEEVGSGAFKNTKYWNDWPDNSFVVKDGWLLGIKGVCPGDAVLSNDVKHIANGAFANSSTLTNLVISGSVLTVGAQAFRYCTNLVSVLISPETHLDPTAFYDSNWLPTGAGEGTFIDPTATMANFFVTFNPNGGVGNMATQTFRYGIAKALSSNLFTRVTYRFDGWATVSTGKVIYSDGQIVSNLTNTADGNYLLYAQWTQLTNLYEIVFNANGGTGTMDPQKIAMGEHQDLHSNVFTRAEYTFQGWSMSATGDVVYVDGGRVSGLAKEVGEKVVLYARWHFVGEIRSETYPAGLQWYYSADTNGYATIVRVVADQFVTAVEGNIPQSLSVPEKLGSKSVVAIGENAFAGLSSLTNIIVPATVSSIAASAFSGCTGIISATIPMVEPLSSIMPDSYRKIKRVTVPGVDEFLEDDAVTICEGAFSSCISLVSVDLPLGVTKLPDACFSGCVALSSFEMPYTVASIGSQAFAGCSALESITVTEYVGEIGSNAFTDCTKFKIVRYLGDEPSAADGDAGNIYYHANASLVSGYLAGIREWASAPKAEETEINVPSGSSTNSTAEAAGTNSTTVVTYTAVKWPAGGAGRPLVAWNNTMYKFKKVTLNYNNGGKTATTNRLYIAGRVLGDLPEPEEDGDFVGWFTERFGGKAADPYTVVDSSMTFYAHWQGDDSGSGSRGLVDGLSPFYSDQDPGFSFAAATFDGMLVSDNAVAGTIQVKTKKGRYVAADKGSNSTFSATMQVLGSKKTTLSGTSGADGTASAENEKKKLSLELAFTQFGMTGSYSTGNASYDIIAARDRYSATSDSAKAVVRAALANAKANWNIVLPTDSADGDGADFANGYSVLSAAIRDKGKANVSGIMADGTKVAVSSKLLVGDSCCCLPVVIPLYPGKSGGFAFALWFTWPEDASERNVSISGLSGWNAERRSGGGFIAAFGEPVVSKAGGVSFPEALTFHMEEFFENGDDAFSPDGMEIKVSSSQWKLSKADTVKFSKDEGWHTPDGKGYGNPAGLKLSYSAATGEFKGSFKVYSVTESGKSKKSTATVNGVVVSADDGVVGYGTATVKKVGSLPVTVE